MARNGSSRVTQECTFENMSVISLFRHDSALARLSYRLTRHRILAVKNLQELGYTGLQAKFGVGKETASRIRRLFRQFDQRF